MIIMDVPPYSISRPHLRRQQRECNGAGPLPREGVLSVIDVQKFSKEVVDEVKARFPERFSEDAEIASSLLSLIAVVAATAIAKYEKEMG